MEERFRESLILVPRAFLLSILFSEILRVKRRRVFCIGLATSLLLKVEIDKRMFGWQGDYPGVGLR